jgi:signal transduction histidine kinase
MLGRLAKLDRAHVPRRTVRLRLTLLYGALFLISGAALLAITYGLVSRSSNNYVLATEPGKSQTKADRLQRVEISSDPKAEGPQLGGQIPPYLRPHVQQLRAQAEKQRSDQLHQLLVWSAVALGLMAMISIGLGWLMAGRVLRPLRTITATTRRISEHNLHERLALDGPRDELTELGDTIDDLLARLEAAFEAQRRFVANASHELRTPLSMMRTSLDVAGAKPGSPSPVLSALDGKLREGLDRADRLLEDFLTLARAQRGALGEQATVALTQAVEGVLQERSGAIEAKRIALDRDLTDAGVIGSETLLRHLVENVIENAILHNERGGWIRVETRPERETARLVVESGGSLLDPSEVRELAQPFRQLGEERTDSQNGAGLGLSIVSAIAEAHGGGLELSARSEGGLRVEIALPLAGAGSGVEGATA